MKEFFHLLLRFRCRELFVAPTQNEIVRMFRYLFVGGIAFLCDYGTFVLANVAFGDAPLAIALENALGFGVGLTVNYLLSKAFIFTEKARGLGKSGEFAAYGLIGLVGLGLGTGLLELFVLVMHAYVAKAIASILVLVYNYGARRVFLYRRGREEPVK